MVYQDLSYEQFCILAHIYAFKLIDFVYTSRLNTDWLWDNFPNERRFASMIFVAGDVLVPEVIQTMYKIR